MSREFRGHRGTSAFSRMGDSEDIRELARNKGRMEGAESETSDGGIEGMEEHVYSRRRIRILDNFRKVKRRNIPMEILDGRINNFLVFRKPPMRG